MNIGTVIISVSILWGGSEIILILMKHSQPGDAKLDKHSTRTLWITILVSVSLGVVIDLQRECWFRLSVANISNTVHRRNDLYLASTKGLGVAFL